MRSRITNTIGDPDLCEEALNRYLYDKLRRKNISFPKASPRGDRGGPLLFADDILIFFSNNDTSTNSVNSILDEFKLEVFQKINRMKSSLIFSKGAPRNRIQRNSENQRNP